MQITIRRRPGVVVLRVRDDGRGFRVEEARDGERPGLGLFGMEERAAYLGGRVEIRSVPGRGTVVRATIGTSDESVLSVPSQRRRPVGRSSSTMVD